MVCPCSASDMHPDALMACLVFVSSHKLWLAT